MGALRSAIAAKIADGKLTVVDSFTVAEPKTKLYRNALEQAGDRQDDVAGRGKPQLDEKLYLGSRNLDGVELVLSSEVHPYDLLRYEHAVFSKDAIEALQVTLKKFVPRRSKAAGKEVA